MALLITGVILGLAFYSGTVIEHISPVGQASALAVTKNSTQNATNLLMDLFPAIMFIMIVFAFILMLSSLVSRIGSPRYASQIETDREYRDDIIQKEEVEREAKKPPKPKWNHTCIQCGAPMWGMSKCEFCGLEYEVQ